MAERPRRMQFSSLVLHEAEGRLGLCSPLTVHDKEL